MNCKRPFSGVKLRHLPKWIDAGVHTLMPTTPCWANCRECSPRRSAWADVLMLPRAERSFPHEALYAVYHQYTILVEDRDALQARLKEAGWPAWSIIRCRSTCRKCMPTSGPAGRFSLLRNTLPNIA